MNMETILTKKQREENIGKIEVLDKVGKLLSLGKTEFSTVKQIAEYYGVGEEAIQSVYKRHKNEIDLDGVKHESSEEIIKLIVHDEQLRNENMSGKKNIDGVKHEPSEEIIRLIEHGVQLKIESFSGKKVVDGIVVPNRGMKLFPKRAVLRIGMLLRDSKVAAELRSRLLNIVEAAENTPQNNGKTIVENNLNLIETEKELRSKWGKAIAEGDNLMANVYATQLTNLLMENRKVLNNTITIQDFVINNGFDYNRSLTRIFKDTGITANCINNYLISCGYLVRKRHPQGICNNPYPTDKLDPSCYTLKQKVYGECKYKGEIIKQHTENEMRYTPEGIKFIINLLVQQGFIRINNNNVEVLKEIK